MLRRKSIYELTCSACGRTDSAQVPRHCILEQGRATRALRKMGWVKVINNKLGEPSLVWLCPTCEPKGKK